MYVCVRICACVASDVRRSGMRSGDGDCECGGDDGDCECGDGGEGGGGDGGGTHPSLGLGVHAHESHLVPHLLQQKVQVQLWTGLS